MLGALPASSQLESKALLAACHGPVVVGSEGRSQEPPEPAEKWFRGVDSPVVGDQHLGSVLLQRPAPCSFQVSRCFERVPRIAEETFVLSLDQGFELGRRFDGLRLEAALEAGRPGA